jgi:hypothetical protein
LWEQESGGILQIPEESRVNTNSCPAGIHAKNSGKSKKKQEFLRPPQNHVQVKKSSRKHRKKRNPQESCCFSVFEPQKMNS